jgi:DNA recombination protein RmuC
MEKAMINFLSLEFLLGIIVGCLVVVAIYQLTKRNNDNSSLETKITAIQNLLGNMKTEEDQRTGSINTALTDIKTASQEISLRSQEIKNTLISGPGQKQGAWGQMVLEFILGKLGFTEGQEFQTQVSMKTDDGATKIPDVIVHFPDKDGQRDVVIDSKVSLTAWNEYENSDDENIKEEALKRHKKSIRDHIDSLSKKNYQKELGIKSLDGVIMFCPNEAAISTLGNSSRLMMEYAIEKKITLVGPAMLYFTLKTVEYYWRAEKQSKNTQQVIKLAEEIGSISIKVYEGAKKSVESIKKTSDGIDEVMNKIKDGRGSLLGKVNKMEKVGGISVKESQKIPQESKTDELE